jgi:hypothetical protein
VGVKFNKFYLPDLLKFGWLEDQPNRLITAIPVKLFFCNSKYSSRHSSSKFWCGQVALMGIIFFRRMLASPNKKCWSAPTWGSFWLVQFLQVVLCRNILRWESGSLFALKCKLPQQLNRYKGFVGKDKTDLILLGRYICLSGTKIVCIVCFHICRNCWRYFLDLWQVFCVM